MNGTTWSSSVKTHKQNAEARAARGEIGLASLAQLNLIFGRISFFWPGIDECCVRRISPGDAVAFFADAAAGAGNFSSEGKNSATIQGAGFKHGPQSIAMRNKMLVYCNVIAAVANKLDQAKHLPAFVSPFSGISYLQAVRRTPELVTATEWQAILSAIRWPGGIEKGKENYLHYACAKFMAGTGARAIELLGRVEYHNPNHRTYPGFRWRDIGDGGPSPDAVFIFSSRVDERTVPFISGMAEFVAELRARRYHGNPDALVFEGVNLLTGLNEPLRAACKKLGVRPVTQHDLRHYFASQCVLAGVEFRTIADWLGHKDGGLLLAKLYSHLRPNDAGLKAAQVHLQ